MLTSLSCCLTTIRFCQLAITNYKLYFEEITFPLRLCADIRMEDAKLSGYNSVLSMAPFKKFFINATKFCETQLGIEVAEMMLWWQLPSSRLCDNVRYPIERFDQVFLYVFNFFYFIVKNHACKRIINNFLFIYLLFCFKYLQKFFACIVAWQFN